MKVKVLVTQLCPTLCYPMDVACQASLVHGILQARILEWVAIPSPRGSSWPRDQTQVSWILYRLNHEGNVHLIYPFPFPSISDESDHEIYRAHNLENA